MIRDWGKRARGWNHPEQLLEGMTALSRVVTDSGPLQSYLMASELDSARPPERRLSPETVLLLADRFSEFSTWYLIFSEFPELSDASIARFVNVADAIDGISNRLCAEMHWGLFRPTSDFGRYLRARERFRGANWMPHGRR